MFEWEIDGVQYRWSGTRMFASGWMKGVKGWTHDLKVSRLELSILRVISSMLLQLTLYALIA
jgi:hypothetical protein